MIELPIAFATGSEAQAEAAEGNYQDGQATITTADSKRLRIGLPDGTSFMPLWPIVEEDVEINPAAGGYSATRSLVISSGAPLHIYCISLVAHSEAYTHKTLIQAVEDNSVEVLPGTTLELQITFPASTNPTLEIRNQTAMGTVLWSFSNVGGDARTFTLTFVRTAAAWKLWKTNEPTIS